MTSPTLAREKHDETSFLIRKTDNTESDVYFVCTSSAIDMFSCRINHIIQQYIVGRTASILKKNALF
jgi:hypothetical protein